MNVSIPTSFCRMGVARYSLDRSPVEMVLSDAGILGRAEGANEAHSSPTQRESDAPIGRENKSDRSRSIGGRSSVQRRQNEHWHDALASVV